MEKNYGSYINFPSDWEVISLNDKFTIFPTASYSRADLEEEASVKYIHYGDIHTKFDFHLDINNQSLPGISEDKVKKYQLVKEGDLVIADASEDYEGVGKAVEIININDKKIIAGLHTFLIRANSNSFAPKFKGYTLLSSFVREQMYRLATGTKVYSISKESLKHLQIPLPPLAEQNAIANCLSTWDEAIEKQEKLIEAKEIRHKALMQKLLSGKKRLPGFTDEWKEVKLGDLFDFKKGSGLSKDLLTESGQPCILYGELFTKYREVISEVLSFTESSTNVVSKAGDILLPGSTTTTGIDLAKASVILKSNVYLGGDINILRPKAILNSTFVSYLLNYEYKYEISAMAQGITIIHLYGKDLKHIKISIPATKEQDNIVEILEYSINEILIEKQKLDQLKEQKKALMQKLLTGKVRLPLQN